ncbi:hypothetical protein [Streptomyces sp. NPDC017993]|uniref:hypothetical protein n=1 Tax=Streptomyces sp. NPDC017993 TaxID=3365027 RepID=UPI0037A63873
MIARLVRLLAHLLPAYGKHRAAAAPEPSPAPALRRPRAPLPRHKSPYARDAVEDRPLMDTSSPVRPYLLSRHRRWRESQDSPERAAQAERRWMLDMALRGIDVGPVVIHGVRLRGAGTGGRVSRPAAA